VVLLLKEALISWSLAINKHGGHKDLHGSDRQSVIPYVHRRMKLYCSSLPCLSLFLAFTDLSLHHCDVALTRAFYNSRSDSYIETRDPTGGPEVIETLYNI
jgi:hypothetical protein